MVSFYFILISTSKVQHHTDTVEALLISILVQDSMTIHFDKAGKKGNEFLVLFLFVVMPYLHTVQSYCSTTVTHVMPVVMSLIA